MTNQLFNIKHILELLSTRFPTDFVLYKKLNKTEISILEDSLGASLHTDFYDFFVNISAHFQNSGGVKVNNLETMLKNMNLSADASLFIFDNEHYNQYKNSVILNNLEAFSLLNFKNIPPFVATIDEDEIFPFLYEICNINNETSYFTPMKGALKGSIWYWNEFGFYPVIKNDSGDIIYFLDWIEKSLKDLKNDLIKD